MWAAFAIAAGALAVAACAAPAIPPPSSQTAPLSSRAAPLSSRAQSRDGAPRSRTTIAARVVDDPSGKPLAGVLVRLQPWDRGCVKTSRRTVRCPGYLPPRTRTGVDGRFLLRDVRDGDYLLIVGSDSPDDLERPTIHDHIAVRGGTQNLRAPTLPIIPCSQQQYREWCDGVQPSPGITPYPRPHAERDGDYRLTTIDPKRERPCAVAFNGQRVKRHLPPAVVDEWLTESTREINAYFFAYRPRTGIPQPVPFLTIGEVLAAGGNGCKQMLDEVFRGATFTGRWVRKPQLLWFGGTWYRKGNGAGGLAEFPLDPRERNDRTVGPWP